MKSLEVYPRRGNRYRWIIVLAIFAFSLALTSPPPWGAYAQDQQQVQQQTQQAQQQTQQAQQQAPQKPEQTQAQIELLKAAEEAMNKIKLVPVSLEGPIEIAKKDGTALPLSLKDVTKMALQANLDIAIQDTNEDLSQQRFIDSFAGYDPQLSVTFGLTDRHNPNSNTTTASSTGFININQTQTGSVSVTQLLHTGGTVSLSWNSNRSDSNVATNIFNPQLSAQGTLNFRQPLIRNFRTDSTRYGIKVANLNLKITDSQFKQQVTNIISNIQTAYWSLVSAIEQYNVSVQSVQLARVASDLSRKKVEVGTAAPIDFIQSQASQATREVTVISNGDRILQAENALKNYISKDRNAEIWGKIIVPTDKPDYVEYKIDLNEALQKALMNRPELEQADLNIAETDLLYKLQQNNKKWQLDLNASVGANGQAGPQSFDRLGNPQLLPAYVGGLFTAYNTLFSQGNFNWSFNFTVGIPLRNTDAKSQLAQTRINREQQIMNRVKSEQSIIVDVKNAVQNLATQKKQLETAQIGVQLGEAQLDAENKRLDAGLSTQFLVLQQQDNLTTYQIQELTAKIAYREAIITLQKAMYTLLEESNINVKSDIPKTPLTFK
jgi:outer membrane protein TolC